MSKPSMVHVITNFAGVGGAEMMLARLIQQTEHALSARDHCTDENFRGVSKYFRALSVALCVRLEWFKYAEYD